MDFDELDELEERQRWALKELQKTQAQQLQKAAQEQYRQWSSKPSKPLPKEQPKKQPKAEPADEAVPDASIPIGLAGFAAPVWSHRKPQPEPVETAPEPAPTRSAPSRPRGFAKFQEMQKNTELLAKNPLPSTNAVPFAPAPTAQMRVHDVARQDIQVTATSAGSADPMEAFAQRLMVHAQEERQLQKSWEQIQSGQCGLPVMSGTPEEEEDADEVPALNALIAILDEAEEEEKEFEQLKPYLPELGHKATSSIVPAGKDGSNPFVTQAVEVFQRFYPDVDLSSAFGDHYKEVLHAAAHRSARGGHIEQLQLRNVERAEEERRAQEERRKLLRELRERRYLIQERQRALGSLGDTKISTKAMPSRIPKALGAPGDATLGGAPNGLLFPGMEEDASPAVEPAVCFPRTSAVETLPAKAKTKPLGLLASLKLTEDEDDGFTLEDLTGLPSSKAKGGYTSSRKPDIGRAEREEAERRLRAAEQQQRLERLKERRMQRDKAKALQAPLGKVTSWGPASEIPLVKR